MNNYSTTFDVVCPVNGLTVRYHIHIATTDVIKVEDLLEELALFHTGFHEDIADQLHQVFGGTQTMWAHHHGVDIRTVRN
jgi:hypothetical protein